MKKLTKLDIWVKLVKKPSKKWSLVIKRVWKTGVGVSYDEMQSEKVVIDLKRPEAYARILCKRYTFFHPDSTKNVKLQWDDNMYNDGSSHTSWTYKSPNAKLLQTLEATRMKRSKIVEFLHRFDKVHYEQLKDLGFIQVINYSDKQLLIMYRHPLYFQYIDKYNCMRDILKLDLTDQELDRYSKALHETTYFLVDLNPQDGDLNNKFYR